MYYCIFFFWFQQWDYTRIYIYILSSQTYVEEHFSLNISALNLMFLDTWGQILAKLKKSPFLRRYQFWCESLFELHQFNQLSLEPK